MGYRIVGTAPIGRATVALGRDLRRFHSALVSRS